MLGVRRVRRAPAAPAPAAPAPAAPAAPAPVAPIAPAPAAPAAPAPAAPIAPAPVAPLAPLALLAPSPMSPSKLFVFTLSAAALVAAAAVPAAQNRMSYSVVSADSGHVALGLAIRTLNVSGTFMQSAAHPDDEHNALFALYTRGRGLRSIDLQTNRGEGGQNEIGPELFR